MRYLATVFLLACLPAQSGSSKPIPGAESVSFEQSLWTVVRAKPEELFLIGQAPTDPKELGGLDAWGKENRIAIRAATNAGIFESPSDPTGLFIEEGTEYSPLELKEGYGNFFLKPNGVFYIDTSAHIVESSQYAPQKPVRLATQSGPLLVSKGILHPRLDPQSTSRTIRNGVGILKDGTIVLGISATSVNLYTMARFFRDSLEAEDVLYLDGTISRICSGNGDCPAGEFSGMLVVGSPLR